MNPESLKEELGVPGPDGVRGPDAVKIPIPERFKNENEYKAWLFGYHSPKESK